MIDPDQICAVKGNGITAPYVLGINISNSNIPNLSGTLHLTQRSAKVNGNSLNDDVTGTAHNPQTLSFDNTACSNSNDCLVGGDYDT